MESRPSDEILFRSLLFNWPRLKKLHLSYQSSGPSQDETDGEDNHPIKISSELVALSFKTELPIIFAGADWMKLKHLDLSGPLDEKMTFSFPNLTYFSFEGPLSSRSLEAVVDGLHHSKSLEHLEVLQRNSDDEYLDRTLAPRLLHFFSDESLRPVDIFLSFNPSSSECSIDSSIDLTKLKLKSLEWRVSDVVTGTPSLLTKNLLKAKKRGNEHREMMQS